MAGVSRPIVSCATQTTRPPPPARSGWRRAAPSLIALVTALTSTAGWVARADEGLRVEPNLAALPLAPVAEPMAGRLPVPMPALAEVPRLVVTRFDGTVLVDVAPFDRYGYPVAEAFEQIARAFAAPSGHQVEIHPRLVEVLLTLSLAFDGKPIQLVSAHREPGRGTRKTSYHVKGMAADVAIMGVRVHELRKAAIRLDAWGVGVYPTFVHVDVRDDRPYRWTGGSRGGWRRRR
jgi:hypothetical protein